MKPRRGWINPINPYTGQISIMAIMSNIDNGWREFPQGMGDTKRKAKNEKEAKTNKAKPSKG